jgi:pantoate--beta-alanine ligase
VRTVDDVRTALAPARRRGGTIGLVPTMGALHEGHLSLIRRARADCDEVVVSVFVNPTQFNEAADLDAYPRDLARDVELAASAGANVTFAPAAAEMYPSGFATSVLVTGVTEMLEGTERGVEHFRGVATIVTKLLTIVSPDIAYFGQKDAQQTVVVRRLVSDLNLPVRIVVCPTVRESDGLALSSRNARLAPDERERALSLSRGLQAAERRHADGERDATRLLETAAAAMAPSGVAPEYLAVVDARTLLPVDRVEGPVLLAVAARIGDTRLIDNVLLAPPSGAGGAAIDDGRSDLLPDHRAASPEPALPRT